MSVDTSKITTIVYPEYTYFLRDPGPIFLSDGKSLKMANWQGVDSSNTSTGSTTVRKAIDDSLALRFGYEIENSPLRYDGGAIEVNSHSAMSIKDYALDRNEGKFSIEEIEGEILRLYGKKQMIWLEGVPLMEKNGLKVDNYWGYAPRGHIDAVARFANDSTILVATITKKDKDNNPIAKHDYEIFQGYLSQLKERRRPNGKPYKVVEIPSPDISLYLTPVPVKYWDSETLEYYNMDHFTEEDTILVVPAMNYANYFVTNGAVLVPEYWEEGLPASEKEKDNKMKNILKKYFPERDIVGVRSAEINMFGGGIHCATQQEPKIN
jgi:agmatine deiminase